MTVDTRGIEDTHQRSLQRENSIAGNSNGGSGGAGNGGGGGTGGSKEGGGGGGNGEQKDIVATPLERLIHTKWMDAKITFHGPAPPSLNY